MTTAARIDELIAEAHRQGSHPECIGLLRAARQSCDPDSPSLESLVSEATERFTSQTSNR